jgi:hypothetical protein
MAKLTKANLIDVIEGISYSEYRKLSPDEESKKDGIAKTIMLEIDYSGLTLNDLLTKAYKSDCVSWQNGSGGRKAFDKLVDKQTVKISAKSPGGAPQIDPVDAIIAGAKAAGMNAEDYIRMLIAKRV